MANFFNTFLTTALFICLFCSGSQAQNSTAVLITGARVADGTGVPLVGEDVRVQGDRIVAIGKLRREAGERVIDARGLVLAPGFIDLHNHSTAIDKDPAAATQVSQGITTILLGQDGNSPWPAGAWLQQRRDHPAALNLQLMAGHATIRRQVMGDDYKRAANSDEIRKMAQLVDQAMREGAVGFSSGLEYEVGSYSTTAELVAMATAAARHGGVYFSHVRDEGDQAMDSFREIIQIADQAKIPVSISHIKLGTESMWGRAPQVVQLINAARARGTRIVADCYPYEAWSSTITVLVLNKQYDDRGSVGKGLADVGGAGNVTITRCARHPDFEGRTLAEVARAQGLDEIAMYSQIVRDGGAGIVCHAMKDEDIRTFYAQPWTAVGSDGGIGMQHPRGAGTYPRVLGIYVRERAWLTLPEAIRKMTSMPAARLNLKDRGIIRKGAYADLVLFNPDTVIDLATFAEPQKPATGIEKVFVNGELVWDGAKTTGKLPGRVIPAAPRTNPFQ